MGIKLLRNKNKEILWNVKDVDIKRWREEGNQIPREATASLTTGYLLRLGEPGLQEQNRHGRSRPRPDPERGSEKPSEGETLSPRSLLSFSMFC